MMDDRLPTDLWVMAQARQCSARGIPFYITRKGAVASGTVMVKIVVRGQGARLFNQSRDMDGNTGWMDVFDGETVDEKRADEYISRAITRDPDVWAVEVEDDSGKNPFDGKIF
jgi:hypothetical protein